MKKVSFFLAMLMAVTMLASCGQDAQESSSVASSPSVNADGEVDTSTPIRFTMFNNDISFGKSDWDNEIIAQEITKQTNVSFDIDMPLSDDGQKINLMLAGGETLPDFIYIENGDSPVISKLIEGDYVYSLDELMEKYAPEMAEMPIITENRAYYEHTDGQIYFIPTLGQDMSKYGDGVEMTHYAGIGRREDIWEELGKPSMTTPEELEQFLLQVKETHPEITSPLLLTYPNNYDISWNGVLTNYYAFGGKGNWFQDDGTKYFIRDPKFEESLMFLNRLYREGLISISTFTDSVDMQVAKTAQAQIAVYLGGIYKGSSVESQAIQVVPTLKYRVFDMPTKEGETFEVPGSPVFGAGSKCIFITKDCKDPARAIKFLEWMVSDYGQAVCAAGREGVDWQYTELDGKTVIEPIGDFKENFYNADVMNQQYGYSKYTWGNMNYASCQVSWGMSLSDEEQLRRNEQRAKTMGDYTIYDGVEPAVDSDEGVAFVKIKDLVKTYVPKVVLAQSEEEAKDAYNELLSKADASGLEKVEAVVDANYQANVESRG